MRLGEAEGMSPARKPFDIGRVDVGGVLSHRLSSFDGVALRTVLHGHIVGLKGRSVAPHFAISGRMVAVQFCTAAQAMRRLFHLKSFPQPAPF